MIAATLSSIPSSLYALVIVADNGSTDNTVAVASAAGATVVSQPERGYGVACLQAIASLPDDIEAVVFMQADLSENPAEAEALLEPIWNAQADMVLGSRTLGQVEAGALLPHQVFGNWLATWLVRMLYGHSYTDLGPYRAIRRDALDRLKMRERRYGWTIEMQVRALEEGLRVLEIPVSYKPRFAGENKVSGNLKASVLAGLRIIWTIFRLRARYVRARLSGRLAAGAAST